MCRSTALVALAISILYPPPLAAQDTGAFYEQNCAACHTIGHGPQGGPDLKGVTARRQRDWLVRFLVDPGAFSADPEVRKMIAAADGMEMPPIDGVNRERAEALIAFIEQQSAGGGPAAAPESPAPAGDAEAGRALFAGATRLSARGPSCIACHHVATLASPGGGALGPDLTQARARLGGGRGLTAWLGATPTPVMRAIYHDVPLTPAEAASVAAYLEETAALPAPPRPVFGTLTIAGIAIAGVALALIAVAGRRRFRSVRRPLVTGARAHMRVVARRAPGEHATKHGEHVAAGGAR